MTTLFRSPSLNKLSPLLGGFDAGHYPLPDVIIDGVTIARRLRQAAKEIPAPDVMKARRELQQTLAEVALSGDKWPDGAALAKTIDARQRYDSLMTSLRWAVEDAEQNLEQSILAHRDSIITGCLRPALAKLLDDVRPHAEAFTAHRLKTDAQLLDAPDDVRTAARELSAAHAGYSAIRSAQYLLDPPSSDAARHLSDYRNIKALFGDRWTGYHLDEWRPWPIHDGRAFVCWLAGTIDPAPDVWLPTPAEWQQEYLRQFEDGRQRVLASRAAGSGGAVRTTGIVRPPAPPKGSKAERVASRLGFMPTPTNTGSTGDAA